MWTMFKYELQRNRIAYAIFAGILAALEIGYAISVGLGKERAMAGFLAALVFAGGITLLFVMINGILLYSRDLNQKTGYMVFMTPLSAYKIIGAKLITTLIVSSALLAAYIGFGVLNFNMIAAKYDVKIVDVLLSVITRQADMTIANLGLIAIWNVILGYISLFTIILFAYFAMSVSATILQNSKAKKFVSFLIFVGLIVALTLIERLMPGGISSNFAELIKIQWPSTLFEVICCIGAFWGTGYLLEKKINL